MTSRPTISIVTPVWNALPYVKETIESVLADEFQDWEMVIGDNASTDGTSEYLRSLTDPRIRVFIHEQNFGVYYNIRFVWSKAKAPIALGLCGDDYLYPGALTTVLNEWKNAPPDTAYISFNWKHRQINHSRLTKYSYEVLPKILDAESSKLGFFLFGNLPGNFSEVCVNVDIVNAADNFVSHMKFAGDYEFWSRLAKIHPVIMSDANIVFIRRHDRVQSTYMTTKGEAFAQRLTVYEKFIDELSSSYGRKRLIAFYNIETRSFQLRDAIRAIVHGRFANFKAFMNTKSPIFWPKWIQLIVCTPLALYEGGRLRLSVLMARNIINRRK